jgi:hypothetical protein
VRSAQERDEDEVDEADDYGYLPAEETPRVDVPASSSGQGFKHQFFCFDGEHMIMALDYSQNLKDQDTFKPSLGKADDYLRFLRTMPPD